MFGAAGNVERVAGAHETRLAGNGEFENARQAVGHLLMRVTVQRADAAGSKDHLDHHQRTATGADLALDQAGLDALQRQFGIGEEASAHGKPHPEDKAVFDDGNRRNLHHVRAPLKYFGTLFHFHFKDGKTAP